MTSQAAAGKPQQIEEPHTGLPRACLRPGRDGGALRPLIRNDFAIGQMDSAPRPFPDSRIMRHHDERQALPVHLLDELDDLPARDAVEIAGGFIGEQQPGTHHHRARDRRPLLLAARKLVGAVLGPRGQAHRGERVSDPLPPLLGENPGEHHRQFHVSRRRQPRHQVEKLKDKPDLVTAQAGQLQLRQPRRLLARKPVGARGGPIQAPQQVQEGRFARAGRAHDRDILAPLDPQVDLLERVNRAPAHDIRAMNPG